MRELGLFRKIWFWLGLFGLLFLGIVWQRPDGKLHLYFCDVGQGDAILVTYQFVQILIDGGPDRRVLDCLSQAMPFWDRKIEVVINSHPEADHLTGLVDVLERYRVTYLLVNSQLRDSALERKFQEVSAQEGALVDSPVRGEEVKIGEMSLKFLWPEKQSQVLGISAGGGELNETSLVVELNYGDFQALLTGDISRKIEEKLDLREIEVLKVAHHGSRFSTGEKLLEETKPVLAVISVGKNSFGHPTDEVLGQLRKKAIKLLRTDLAGTIEVVSDGREWGVQK